MARFCAVECARLSDDRQITKRNSSFLCANLSVLSVFLGTQLSALTSACSASLRLSESKQAVTAETRSTLRLTQRKLKFPFVICLSPDKQGGSAVTASLPSLNRRDAEDAEVAQR